MGRDVFVSYAGSDRAWAEWAAWHLQDAGYTVELDVWDWQAGENVILRMNDALESCGCVLMLWSGEYFDRNRFTTDEWPALLAERPEERGRLVPVRVADVTPPILLKPLAYRDVYGVDEDEARARLLAAVGGPSDVHGKPEFPGSGKPKRLRAPAVRPPGVLPSVWKVPRRNPLFIGRDDSFVGLRERLGAGHAAVVQAVHGWGGVGKTTLAIEYAHRFAGAYELVWWIDAEQPALIGEQFTALGVAAGWISPTASAADPTAVVRQRLRTEPGWLLIFDNANGREDLLAWLPEGAGHVMVTSRNPGWNQLAEPLPLPEFTRAESVALLRRSLAGVTDGHAGELADRLGDLPLAVAQAALWLRETGTPVATYLEMLDKQIEVILSVGVPDGYPAPLAAVVQTSVQRLAQEDEAAGQLLTLCAFLAPEPIPTTLFTTTPDALPHPLADRVSMPVEFGETTRRVGAYGLARIGDGTLQLHRLTQAILRASLNPTDRPGLRERVETLLAAARPDDGRDPATWPIWAQLVPHVLSLDPAASTNPGFRQLACDASSYLISRGGDMEAAHHLCERLYREWQERFGADDPQALFAGTNLANTYTYLGRFAEAYRTDLVIYDQRRDLLGDDHPDTLTSAANLAVLLNRLGRHGEAEQFGRETYERHRRIFGDNHPYTLTSAGNLAGFLSDLGRHGEAEQFGRDTYEHRRRVLGDDHPETLASASNLAGVLSHLGRHGEAEQLGRDTNERLRRVLGDNHPDTLASAGNLAGILSRLGRHREAEQLGRDTNERLRRVLGDDHPHAITSAGNLAGILSDLGRHREAEQLGRDTNERLRRVLGDNHPDTLNSAHVLVQILLAMRRPGQARKLAAWIRAQNTNEDTPDSKP